MAGTDWVRGTDDRPEQNSERKPKAAAHRIWQWRLYLVIAAAVCASMTNTPITVTVVSDKIQRRRSADIPTGIAFYV